MEHRWVSTITSLLELYFIYIMGTTWDTISFTLREEKYFENELRPVIESELLAQNYTFNSTEYNFLAEKRLQEELAIKGPIFGETRDNRVGPDFFYGRPKN